MKHFPPHIILTFDLNFNNYKKVTEIFVSFGFAAIVSGRKHTVNRFTGTHRP